MSSATYNPRHKFQADPELWADANTVFYEFHRNCQAPRYIRVSRWKSRSWDVAYSEQPGLLFRDRKDEYLRQFFKVRCRSCPSCEDAKQRAWIIRAMSEWRSADVTFFVTLTFSEQWFRVRWRERQAKDLEKLGDSDEALERSFEEPPAFHERGRGEEWSYLSRELDRYLRRVRDIARQRWGAEMRYFAVREVGPVGRRPHFHMLVHFKGSRTLNKRTMERTLKRGWAYQSRSPEGRKLFKPVGRTTCEAVLTDRRIYYNAKYVGKGSPERRVIGRSRPGLFDDPSFIGPPEPWVMEYRRYGVGRIRASERYGWQREVIPSDVLESDCTPEGGTASMTTRSATPLDVWPSGRTMGKAHTELSVSIIDNDEPTPQGEAAGRAMVPVRPGGSGEARRTRAEGAMTGPDLTEQCDTRDGKPVRRRERWSVAVQSEMLYTFPSWAEQLERYRRRDKPPDG